MRSILRPVWESTWKTLSTDKACILYSTLVISCVYVITQDTTWCQKHWTHGQTRIHSDNLTVWLIVGFLLPSHSVCLAIWPQLQELWTELPYLHLASGLQEKSKERQGNTLLHIISEDALRLYDGLRFDEGNEFGPDHILDHFRNYCTPKTNVTNERHVFNTRVQKPGETFVSFYTELYNLSKTCEYADFVDQMLETGWFVGSPIKGCNRSYPGKQIQRSRMM